MFIIAGKAYVDPEYRASYLSSFEETIRLCRTQAGCLDCVYAADPFEEDRINQFEMWESDEHFAAWQSIVEPPASVTEILEMDVKKYEISASGPVFS